MLDTLMLTVKENGIPVGAKRAFNFCFLAYEGFVGRPLRVTRHSESNRTGVIGQIQPGDNDFRSRRHMARF